jgi:AcrR family transcriptional regulator
LFVKSGGYHMPYPAQIDAEKIVAKARQMIETEGADNLSLHQLAAALGVKAPSLYRHFASKTDLLRAVNLGTAQSFGAAVLEAVENAGDDPRSRVLALARATRTFAQNNPKTYALAYTNASPELRPDESELVAVAIPLQRVMAEISGEGHSLAALRGAWALVHGFVMMEMNGQFQRGGDLSLAFTQAVEAYINGWEKTQA